MRKHPVLKSHCVSFFFAYTMILFFVVFVIIPGLFSRVGAVYRYEVITNAVNNAPLGVRPVPENEYPVFEKPERGDISTQLACWTCSSVKQDLLPKDGLPEITTKLDGFSECKPYLQGVFDQATSEFGEITRFDPEDNAHCLVIESVDGELIGGRSWLEFAR
ncbi:unnamed protein product [Notodromas monacha]|uniref:Uncharacterized protein n=1 Tax=Notodromas monacha TaxID=399045 RepID=A0A7R9GL85_9CRUS|nr:unnamed protein product [Notodromas monacha]CAG0925437.1 unnamed protein product [Notodromas monacha]